MFDRTGCQDFIPIGTSPGGGCYYYGLGEDCRSYSSCSQIESDRPSCEGERCGCSLKNGACDCSGEKRKRQSAEATCQCRPRTDAAPAPQAPGDAAPNSNGSPDQGGSNTAGILGGVVAVLCLLLAAVMLFLVHLNRPNPQQHSRLIVFRLNRLPQTFTGTFPRLLRVEAATTSRSMRLLLRMRARIMTSEMSPILTKSLLHTIKVVTLFLSERRRHQIAISTVRCCSLCLSLLSESTAMLHVCSIDFDG